MSQVRIDLIKVGARTRRDLGDIDALTASITEVGLLQPVVLDKDFNLIAGFRRLEAFKRMDRQQIEALVVGGLQDIVLALHAERDENTCRKEFTVSELVAIGCRIEEAERPKSEDRMKAGVKEPSGLETRGSKESESTRTRGVVGKALGISGPTYDRAKAVVSAAENATDPAHELAKDLLPKVDAGEIPVSRAARQVRDQRRQSVKGAIVGGNDRSKAAVQARRDAIRRLAASGCSAGQLAKQLGISEDRVRLIAKENGIEIAAEKVLGRSRRVDANRVVESTVADLDASMSSTHALMEGRYADLDPDRVATWVASLEESRKSLTKFIAALKETTRV